MMLMGVKSSAGNLAGWDHYFLLELLIFEKLHLSKRLLQSSYTAYCHQIFGFAGEEGGRWSWRAWEGGAGAAKAVCQVCTGPELMGTIWAHGYNLFLAGGEKDGRYKGTFQGRQHEPTGASRSILHFTCTFFLKVGPAQMAQLNQQMSKMIDPGVLKQMGGVLNKIPPLWTKYLKEFCFRYEWTSKYDETDARQCGTWRSKSKFIICISLVQFCCSTLTIVQVPDMAQMESMMKKMGARRK